MLAEVCQNLDNHSGHTNEVRAYPTRKLADQLMWRWCESHDHTSEAEQKKCHVWRDSLVNKHWGDKEWEKDMDERSSLNRALKHLDINSLSQVPAVHNEPIQAEQRPSLIVKLAISFPIVSTLDTDDELYRDLTPLPPNLMDASRQRRISTSSFESDLDGSESISVSSSEVLEGSSSSESE